MVGSLESKRTHGHGQQCGNCGGRRGYKGVNAMENYNKVLKNKRKLKIIQRLTQSEKICLLMKNKTGARKKILLVSISH